MLVRIVSFSSSFPASCEHAEQNLINWLFFLHKIAGKLLWYLQTILFFFLSGHSRSLKNSKTIIFAYLCFHNCYYEASPSLRCDSSTNRNQYSSTSATQPPNVAPKPEKEVTFSISTIALDALGQFRHTGLAHWNGYYPCSLFIWKRLKLTLLVFF